jgi:hypothetical protein
MGTRAKRIYRDVSREERFWPKVDKTAGPNACWPWLACGDPTGYGRFVYENADGKRRLGLAHRFAYEVTHGPIPDGLEIDHLCRNRSCSNPKHLEAVTTKVNHERGTQRMRTNCPSGHPYEPPHLGVNKRGWRFCRTCMNESGRKWRMSKRIELTGEGGY